MNLPPMCPGYKSYQHTESWWCWADVELSEDPDIDNLECCAKVDLTSDLGLCTEHYIEIFGDSDG